MTIKRQTYLLTLCILMPTSALAADVLVQVSDGAGKPLANAVVFVESRETRAAVKPMTGIEMGQINRQFTPQVLTVTTGTAVAFPNRDKVRHHIYSFSPVKPFEIKLYTGSAASPVVFDKPGIALLGCNIHDQMVAWIVVVDTPYHTRSDARGVAHLDVRTGSYRLNVWHPGLPVGSQPTVKAVQVTTELNLSVKLEGVSP